MRIVELHVPSPEGHAFHHAGWVNRLVAGDCLPEMSCLRDEGFAGAVQAVYLDPPYGIDFRTTFRIRSATPARDTRIPKATSEWDDDPDTGVYLDFLEPRLEAARSLLHASGSLFLQIGDAQAHRVRTLLDRVFGARNHVATICFQKTGGQRARVLARTVDFLHWYARDRTHLKHRPLFVPRAPDAPEAEAYDQVLFPDGTRLPLARAVELGRAAEGRRFQATTLTSQNPGARFPVTFEGRTFTPGPGQWWKTDPAGLRRLIRAGRVVASGRTLRYVRFLDDHPARALTNLWTDTACSLGERKLYPVQTHTRVVERCLLLATDPGDLVLDPMCGSGTTPWVAERWGRRWIAMDASPTALAVTRQRLVEATFEHWKLLDPAAGPAGGFALEDLPHVTLQSITRNVALDDLLDQLERAPDPTPGRDRDRVEAAIRAGAEPEPRVDRPLRNARRRRPAGPFRVAPLPHPNALPEADGLLDLLARHGLRGVDGEVVRPAHLDVARREGTWASGATFRIQVDPHPPAASADLDATAATAAPQAILVLAHRFSPDMLEQALVPRSGPALVPIWIPARPGPAPLDLVPIPRVETPDPTTPGQHTFRARDLWSPTPWRDAAADAPPGGATAPWQEAWAWMIAPVEGGEQVRLLHAPGQPFTPRRDETPAWTGREGPVAVHILDPAGRPVTRLLPCPPGRPTP